MKNIKKYKQKLTILLMSVLCGGLTAVESDRETAVPVTEVSESVEVTWQGQTITLKTIGDKTYFISAENSGNSSSLGQPLLHRLEGYWCPEAILNLTSLSGTTHQVKVLLKGKVQDIFKAIGKIPALEANSSYQEMLKLSLGNRILSDSDPIVDIIMSNEALMLCRQSLVQDLSASVLELISEIRGQFETVLGAQLEPDNLSKILDTIDQLKEMRNARFKALGGSRLMLFHDTGGANSPKFSIATEYRISCDPNDLSKTIQWYCLELSELNSTLKLKLFYTDPKQAPEYDADLEEYTKQNLELHVEITHPNGSTEDHWLWELQGYTVFHRATKACAEYCAAGADK